MRPTPVVNQELVWARGRFLKIRQAVDQIEELVALASDPIGRSEQLNNLGFTMLTRTEARAKLDHELVFTPHPFVHVIVPGAAFKMSFRLAQVSELGRDIFDGVHGQIVSFYCFEGSAGCVGTTSAPGQEEKHNEHQ